MERVITVLCLVPIVIAAEARPNIIGNSSFEGGAAGWNFWRQHPAESSGGVVEGQTRWGERAFRVSNQGDGGANLFSDPIPAVAGADYTLSVYARTKGARGVRVALWAEDARGEVISYEVPFGASVPGDQPAWARFKSIIRAPENCAALKAHLTCNGGTVWWDAVQLERGRDTTWYRDGPALNERSAGRKNLLTNSGFEGGDIDWSLWHEFPGRSSGGVEGDGGRLGSAGFHVVNPGGGGANLHSDAVPCKPDTAYTLSVYARVENGRRVAISGWGLDNAGETVSYAIGGPMPLPNDVAEYRRFSATFTTPDNCAFLKAHLVCNGGEVWWDDCQLEAGKGASEYSPGARAHVFPPRQPPEAVKYTRAIIREARLRDVMAQTERLVSYARNDRGPGLRAAVADIRRAVASIAQRIDAQYLVPDYCNIDYDALNAQMGEAEGALADLWRRLDHDPKGIFERWEPQFEGDISTAELSDGFFIFPCFTRDYFFEGDGNWDLLEPFGFRIVSGWWGMGASPGGELRSEGLDRIVEICAEHGYRCDVAADGSRAARTVLEKRLGEAIYLHTADGEWSPQGNCHNTINIWHPQVRRVARDYLAQCAEHFGQVPGIVCCELTNEPSLTIEKREHGYRYKRIGVGGYSPEARAAWHNWLRAKYETLDRLNARWRTEYSAFGQATPPRDLKAPQPENGTSPVAVGAIYDFQTFRAESHADWFAMCLEALHRSGADTPVISQLLGGNIDRKEAAVDLRMMTEDAPWDIYGTHDWPGDGPASRCLYAVSMNRRAGRPHWEDEFIWSQWERKGTPEPVMRAAVERNLWRQFAWGKRGISLFNLESEWLHDHPRNWNNSMLNIEADLEVPRHCVGVIPTIERKANLLKDILYETQIVGKDVALLRPTAATIVTAPELSVRKEATFIADTLLRWHVMPLMIPEEHIIDGHRPDAGVIIAPWTVNAPGGLQRRLLEWMKDGGCVFATGPFGLFDEYGAPSATMLKSVLGDLDWAYDAENGRWVASSLDELKPTVQRRTVAESEASLLIGQMGKGRLYLWPERLETAKQAGVLQRVLDDVVPQRHVTCDLDKLEIIPRQSANGEQYLFIINLNARTAQSGEIMVRGHFERVTDLSCEAHPIVPVEHAEGVTSIPVSLAPGGAVFMGLGRSNGAG